MPGLLSTLLFLILEEALYTERFLSRLEFLIESSLGDSGRPVAKRAVSGILAMASSSIMIASPSYYRTLLLASSFVDGRASLPDVWYSPPSSSQMDSDLPPHFYVEPFLHPKRGGIGEKFSSGSCSKSSSPRALSPGFVSI